MIDENLQLVGIWFSIVSLFTTLGLAWYIYHLDKKQRERDETFYVTTTMRDIKGLKEHLINIHNISESEEPIPSNDEKIDISQRLAEYTKRNEKIIEVLIIDTRLSMSKWMNLEDQERENIENLIKTTRWTLNDYLPKPNENEEAQTTRWSTYFEEFQNRKNESVRKIRDLELKYA